MATAYMYRYAITLRYTRRDLDAIMPNEMKVTVSPVQFNAIRKMSLKYEDMSVEKYGQKLFDQIVRSYFSNYAKAIEESAGKQFDGAMKLGFILPEDLAKLPKDEARKEYVRRAVAEVKEIAGSL